MKRIGVIVLSLAGAFVGCRCEEAPAPAQKPVTVGPPPAEPVGPPVAGWSCPGAGNVVESASLGTAFREGNVAVRKGVGWEDPGENTARFLTIPGVRDVAQEGAYMILHRLPGSQLNLVLSATVHEFPPEATFDAKGFEKVFDEVAANPHALLVGRRQLQWGGRNAVEGAVKSPQGMVHHLIVQLDGQKGLDVIFIGPEADYHRYLGEACDAVVVVK